MSIKILASFKSSSEVEIKIPNQPCVNLERDDGETATCTPTTNLLNLKHLQGMSLPEKVGHIILGLVT